MQRKLLASTALTLAFVGGAYAQETLPADPMAPAAPMAEPAPVPEVPLVTAADVGIDADGWLATEIIGETIYNSTAEDAEAIGDVNDFVLNSEGHIAAIVVGVGGFLGIGQRDVAINWEDLELVVDASGDNRVVASLTREQLENAAQFDPTPWLASQTIVGDEFAPADPGVAPAPMDAAPIDAPADTAPEPVPAETVEEPLPADTVIDDPAPADPAAPVSEGPLWDTYETVAIGDISSDEVIGTTVYGAGDENIGSVGDILLADDGGVEAAVIDFGGFLGIGTKAVAVDYESLNFLRDEGGDLVIRTGLSEAELDAAPEYDPEAYTATPDQYVIFAN